MPEKKHLPIKSARDPRVFNAPTPQHHPDMVPNTGRADRSSATGDRDEIAQCHKPGPQAAPWRMMAGPNQKLGTRGVVHMKYIIQVRIQHTTPPDKLLLRTFAPAVEGVAPTAVGDGEQAGLLDETPAVEAVAPGDARLRVNMADPLRYRGGGGGGGGGGRAGRIPPCRWISG